MNEQVNIKEVMKFSFLEEGDGISRIYFIGIGGIGMSALARYCKSKGMQVSGYDKTETRLTRQLTEEGILVHYSDDIKLIDKEAQLVVFTPAVPKDNLELNYYRLHKYKIVKRSDVLGEITNRSFNICIAGTHGKTTTSTMIAHILRHSGYGCNAFLGGIAVNYQSNFWSSPNNVCVVEADEYDRSFLKLSPDIAIITAMDADHLDIYGTVENVEQAFIEFAARIKPNGLLLSKKGLQRWLDLKAANHLTYHLEDKSSDVFAGNITLINGSYHFDIITKEWELCNLILNMGGKHNIENVIAAVAVAHFLGIADEKIKMAVEEFRGVKRRFEYIIKHKDQVMIDDYAHHPEELRVLITGAKELYPGKWCTVIFQPHLYSRTRDFAEGFAASLDLADEVILLPVYPARELPVEGVNSELIMHKMKNQQVSVKTKDNVMAWVGNAETEILIMAGAGDIDMLIDPVKKILSKSA